MTFRNENGALSLPFVLHCAQIPRKKGQYFWVITVRYTTITYTTFYKTVHQTSWSTWPMAFLTLCADSELDTAPEMLAAVHADASDAESCEILRKWVRENAAGRSWAQSGPTQTFKKTCSVAIDDAASDGRLLLMSQVLFWVLYEIVRCPSYLRTHLLGMCVRFSLHMQMSGMKFVAFNEEH